MTGEDHPFIPIDPDLAPDDASEPSVGPPGWRPRRHEHRARPDVLAAIAIGGMVGASARYVVARGLVTEPGEFPWATFWTNVAGSFLLGFLLVLLLERFPPTRLIRPFVVTGLLGAFTTMSTYQVETALLLKDGHGATAVTYSVGSVLVGLALAHLGIRAGRLGHRRGAS